ncbi:GNAT family N-acetyltransferase [Nocardioides nanhaiensis]|uniref:N-acetyltransferase domain-containing protein n=1 Tax=Nocardioides nanhaiensis TaxID=1476871 RepID=A0ABP8WTR6_9ACTN
MDRDEVLAAVAAWIWTPDEAERVETEEYLLTRNPGWFQHPLTLHWLRPRRPWREVLEEVLEQATLLGGGTLDWHHRLDAPPEVEQHLRAVLSARLHETLDVFARSLEAPGDQLSSPAPPEGVELRWVDDVERLREADAVGAAVFGDDPLPSETLERHAAVAVRDLRVGRAARVVAYADGEPVGTSGVTSRGSAAGLWGGSVVEHARGRGIYRAMLEARLAWAAGHGMRLALVKGRVETSGPILRRSGFAEFGQERAWLVAVDGS